MKIWNGMYTDKNISVAKKIRKYSVSLAFVGILVCVTAIFFLLYYARIYNQITDSNMWLQEMYQSVDKAGEAVEDYSFLGEAKRREEYMEQTEKIYENLDKLFSLKIEGNYTRNLKDLKRLLDKYMFAAENIMNLSEQDNSQETSNSYGDIQNEVTVLHNLKESIVYKKTIFSNEIYSYFFQGRVMLQKEMKWMIGLLAVILISGILLMLSGTKELSTEIIKPLEEISQSAKIIQEYQFNEISDYENSQDNLLTDTVKGLQAVKYEPKEIAVLQDVFCKMLLCIQKQITDLKANIKIREQLKEAEVENLRVHNMLAVSELKCLQTQVNPHFLFNTLNMIQQTVYLDKKEKTSFLLKETASFLRYSLDYAGKTVTLQKELEALGNYVSLQEERLGDRVLFEFELDESINQILVPSLILQPLIENSLIHGVGDFLEGGLIRVSTHNDPAKKCGVIEIWDNGHGISEEMLQALRNKMNQIQMLPDKKIGLENVYKRLLLLTGYPSVMKIDSTIGKEFKVDICIPYEQEEI